MSVKDNIYLFLSTKGISPTKAERELGWSVGALTKANSVTSDRLKEFILFYSDISPEWLLTGSGEMLKKPTNQEASGNVSTLEAEKSFLEKEFFYLKAIRDKNADLIKAMDKIEEKEKEILKLKAEIESLKGMLDKQKVV
mgnify:CR=1